MQHIIKSLVASSLFLICPLNVEAYFHKNENTVAQSSKAWTIAKTAAQEIAKGRPESIQKGIYLFESILSYNSFKRLDIASQLSIYMSLAKAYELQNDYPREEILIKQILSNQLFESFHIQLETVLIRLYLLQNNIHSAEDTLDKILKRKQTSLSKTENEHIVSALNLYSKHMQTCIEMAESAFENREYTKAAALYESLLISIKNHKYPIGLSRQDRRAYKNRILLKLAHAHYYSNEFGKCNELLLKREKWSYTSSKEEQVLYLNGCYLLAKSLQQNKNEDKAINWYQKYLHASFSKSTPEYHDAIYQLAFLYYKLQKYSQALDQLKKFESSEGPLSCPVLLLESHIQYALGNFETAASLGKTVLGILPSSSLLYKEALYLIGCCHNQNRNFEEAIIHLEKALTQQQTIKKEKPPWTQQAYLLAATAYIHLAENQVIKSPGKATTYLERSENHLQELFILQPSAAAITASAKQYLLRYTLTKDSQLLDELQLLTEDADSLDKMSQAQLNLFLRVMYNDLSSSDMPLGTEYKDHTSRYTQYLYINALISLSEKNTQKEASERRIDTATFYTNELLTTLENKTTLLKNEEGYLLNLTNLLISTGNYEAFATALDILCKLETSSPKIKEDPQFLYLSAVTALKQNNDKEKAFYFIESHSESPYLPKVLHELISASIRERDILGAQELLAVLLHNYPSCDNKDHLLYLAAYCQDILSKDQELARSYRRELFSNYPESPYAAESYFKYFHEDEYARSTPRAIEHLAEMKTLFCDSPYSIIAAYYTGLAYNQESQKLQKAEKSNLLKESYSQFNFAEECYHLLSPESYPLAFTKEELAHIVLRSRLQKGYVLIQLADVSDLDVSALTKAKEIFENIVVDLQLRNNSSDRLFLLQSHYRLADIYKKLNFDDQSQEQLENLLYCCTNKKQSMIAELTMYDMDFDVLRYYVLAHLELAKCALKKSDFADSLNHFTHIRSMTIKSFFPELYLEIVIEMSGCYRRMQKFDKAMILLSNVINDPFASSLRIKAMVLRAEIYELQKRKDLAIKQLESAAKKGGEWGMVAKNKLKEAYGHR